MERKPNYPTIEEILPAIDHGHGWMMPDLPPDGDVYVDVLPQGRINSRLLARIDGTWWVCWPGFSWQKADRDYM